MSIECPSCSKVFNTSDVCAVDSNYLSADSIRIKWSIGDVLERAQKLNIPIDDNDARKILAVIKKWHDATIGINTEVIDFHIEMFDSSRIDEAIDAEHTLSAENVRIVPDIIDGREDVNPN